MQARYPRSFFALQIEFAQRVATRFSLPLADALWRYTTFARESIRLEDEWESYARLLAQTNDPLELTYQVYLERWGEQRLPQPDDTTFLNRPLFGCFCYVVRNATMIRPHFLNNDLPGMAPLSRARMSARHDELRRMFTHIRRTVPTAATVHGNSWLYNILAYTRLFPPTYAAQMEENTDSTMHMLGLWAQCYDRFWEVKPAMATGLLQRIEQVTDLADLRLCFPYQRLRPRAPIAEFYNFYDITE